MLLNEFLKEHRKVETLEAALTRQENQIKDLNASLKTQASQLQKVSSQLEANRPAPRIVSARE